MCDGLIQCRCYKNGYAHGKFLGKTERDGELRAERAEKQFKDMLESEHSLSDAYVRLRTILGALDAPLELILTEDASLLWDWVERRAERMMEERKDALDRVKGLEGLLRYDAVENWASVHPGTDGEFRGRNIAQTFLNWLRLQAGLDTPEPAKPPSPRLKFVQWTGDNWEEVYCLLHDDESDMIHHACMPDNTIKLTLPSCICTVKVGQWLVLGPEGISISFTEPVEPLVPCHCGAAHSQVVRPMDDGWVIYCNSCGYADTEFTGATQAEVASKWNQAMDKSEPVKPVALLLWVCEDCGWINTIPPMAKLPCPCGGRFIPGTFVPNKESC